MPFFCFEAAALFGLAEVPLHNSSERSQVGCTDDNIAKSNGFRDTTSDAHRRQSQIEGKVRDIRAATVAELLFPSSPIGRQAKTTF